MPHAALFCFTPAGRSAQAPSGSGTAHGCPAPQEHRAAPRRASPFAKPGAEQSPNNLDGIRRSLANYPLSAGKKTTHCGWRQPVTAFCRDKFPRPSSRLPGEAPVLGATGAVFVARRSQAPRVGGGRREPLHVCYGGTASTRHRGMPSSVGRKEMQTPFPCG